MFLIGRVPTSVGLGSLFLNKLSGIKVRKVAEPKKKRTNQDRNLNNFLKL